MIVVAFFSAETLSNFRILKSTPCLQELKNSETSSKITENLVVGGFLCDELFHS